MTISVFGGLTEAEVKALTTACGTRRVGAGEAVFREGDEGDEVFVVVGGRVRIAKAISLDVDRTLATVERGGVFGEQALVGGGARSASALAVEPTEVLVLTRDGFLGLAGRDPALGFKVMGRLAAILAERLQATTDLLRDTVHWGLEVSGAAALDLQHVIHARTAIDVVLVNGERFEGRLIKAEPTRHGDLVLFFTDLEEQLRLVPYHAIVRLRFPLDAALATAAAAGED